MQMIRLGQTLHGYQDGHSLLAGSENLPHGAESTLFVLSDLSGPQVVSGFDEYLTGYPLPEIASYAFAKTWYAPEMQRPGCVWTHTLLVRFADMAQIDNFGTLLSCFKRPIADPKSWIEYKERVTVEVSREAPDLDVVKPPFPIVSSVLKALYDTAELPVLLPAVDSRQFESLVLRIWSQQWPRVRRTFRFCTGAIENRTVDGKPFDLQVVPFKGIARIQREVRDSVLVDSENSVEEPHSRSWLNILLNDFYGRDFALQQFIWEYGADVAPKRSSFKKLIEAFQLSSEHSASFEDCWNTLLTLFPSQAEGARLKLAAALPGKTYYYDLPLSNRVTVLITSQRDSSYPKRLMESPDIERFATDFALADTLQAIASAPNINSFGEKLVQTIASSLSPEQLKTAASIPSALICFCSVETQS